MEQRAIDYKESKIIAFILDDYKIRYSYDKSNNFVLKPNHIGERSSNLELHLGINGFYVIMTNLPRGAKLLRAKEAYVLSCDLEKATQILTRLSKVNSALVA